jgi:phosphoglycerate dehydrogenase-like enzyme
MLKGMFLLDQAAYDKIYGEDHRQQIGYLVAIESPLQTSESISVNLDMLNDIDIIFSGWGCPRFSAELLKHAPNLKVVFYGAGSIRYLVSDEFWSRGIQISSAYQANDVPVAEFTLAQIILSLKGYWHYVLSFKETGRWYEHLPTAGIYGSTVGLISLGMIGRMVARKLKDYQVRVIAYDPYVTPDTAAELGISLCSLEEIFQKADVVTLHTPWLPETEGMIGKEHFLAMKTGAAFINTARGAIVREAEMAEVFQLRPDLYALLDVTYPEPPLANSPLLSMPNVIITPHIAGPGTNECKRNGQYVVEELRRYLQGEPLQFGISREKAAIMA